MKNVRKTSSSQNEYFHSETSPKAKTASLPRKQNRKRSQNIEFFFAKISRKDSALLNHE